MPDERETNIPDGLKRNMLGKEVKLPRLTQILRAEVDAFMLGAYFMRKFAILHNIQINLDDDDVLSAAQQLYPEYDPLPEPTKISTSERRADGITQSLAGDTK